MCWDTSSNNSARGYRSQSLSAVQRGVGQRTAVSAFEGAGRYSFADMRGGSRQSGITRIGDVNNRGITRSNNRVGTIRTQNITSQEQFDRVAKNTGLGKYTQKEGLRVNRVAIRDEGAARRRTRGARANSGLGSERNARSSRGRTRMGSGLRIGGSGVNVPT